MVNYLQELEDINSNDLTKEQKKEMSDLKKELEKYKQMELVGKHESEPDSDSSNN